MKTVLDVNIAQTSKIQKDLTVVKVQLEKFEAGFSIVEKQLQTLIENSSPVDIKNCLDAVDMVSYMFKKIPIN